MGRQAQNREAYQRVSEAFKAQRNGATVADIVAKTALPLQTVRELAPQVADEYAARLEVTESGEIRYSFPKGFTSKYRGVKASLRKAADFVKKYSKLGGMWVFKVWIMFMLFGYFTLFMVIALASLMLSVVANTSSSSSNRSSRSHGGGLGSMYFSTSIFNMIIRMWFYSELFKPRDMYGRPIGSNAPSNTKKRPLHKAIFSFIFGDGDPNAQWPSREKRAVIAYIQAKQGVITLPEFISLTGLPPLEAESRITEYCVEFGGSPEASAEGTVVYRFDDILLRENTADRSFPGYSAPLKGLKKFSSNLKKMNTSFSLINGINLFFGGYFFYNALSTGAILTQAQLDASSYLYGLSYILLSQVTQNPLPALTIGLGLIPICFSLLFWLIPAFRSRKLKKDNERIKLENFRKEGFAAIWNNPLRVNPQEIRPQNEESLPKNIRSAQDRIIHEAGAYASPEVFIDETGSEIFVFPDINREKEAVARYRASIDPAASALGKTIFDSDA